MLHLSRYVLGFLIGSVSGSGTRSLDTVSRDPVPDLETPNSRGPVQDPAPTLRGLSRGPGVYSGVL